MAVNPVPEGYHTATPYLVVRDADALMRFAVEAFGATIVDVSRMPDGTVMHADIVIGDSHVMLGQANDRWPEKPGVIHLYLPDADAVYARALAAGGRSVQEMTTQFYGDRSGGVEDPAGVTWWISTHVEDVSKEEIGRRMAAMRG